MKNKYEIRGDVTVIFVKSKGIELEFLIDTEDLEKISSVPGSWSAIRNGDRYVYAHYLKFKQKSLILHRFISNCPPGLVVDHINHNTLDNRKVNLRNVTIQVNNRNIKGAPSHNKLSGLRGVSWHNRENKWVSYVYVDKKRVSLGYFQDKEKAAEVAEKARGILFEGMDDTDGIMPDKSKPISTNLSSGIRNVHWRSDVNKWHVRIAHKNKNYSFGFYTDLKKAEEVARIERERLHA